MLTQPIDVRGGRQTGLEADVLGFEDERVGCG